MQQVLRILKWLLKAAVFFTLFAFALNNQHDSTVHFFFGNQWRAPQVLVVLVAFTLGVAVGVVGMVPWLRRARRKAQVAPPGPQTSAAVINTPQYADGI